MEDVGSAGWSMEASREIIRQEVLPNHTRGVLPHHYSSKLGGIRVVETTKDLGNLSM